MNALTQAFRTPKRPMFLFGVGVAAALIHLRARGMWGEESFLAYALYAATVAIGLAIDAGIPRARFPYTIVWAMAGAFGWMVFYEVSAGVAAALLGAGIGISVSAPGPLHPVPWQSAARGAVGGCAAALCAAILGSQNVPAWALGGVESLVIGLFLIQGRGARLMASLSSEFETIRAKGSAEQKERAEKILELAVSSIDEIDANEERTGDDRSAMRGEVAALARRALGLIRRIVGLPRAGDDLVESIAKKIEESERRMTEIYRRELTSVLEGA